MSTWVCNNFHGRDAKTSPLEQLSKLLIVITFEMYVKWPYLYGNLSSRGIGEGYRLYNVHGTGGTSLTI